MLLRHTLLLHALLLKHVRLVKAVRRYRRAGNVRLRLLQLGLLPYGVNTVTLNFQRVIDEVGFPLHRRLYLDINGLHLRLKTRRPLQSLYVCAGSRIHAAEFRYTGDAWRLLTSFIQFRQPRTQSKT